MHKFIRKSFTIVAAFVALTLLGLPREGVCQGTLVSWNPGSGAALPTPPGDDFVAVAAGLWHGVALRADGSLVSWGPDFYGEVSLTPTGNGFLAVAAGDYHSVALRADGSLASWGDDSEGQVQSTPPGNDFVAVSAGGGHSVALSADGSLVSWGDTGIGVVSGTPSGTGFIAAAVGDLSGVAIRSDGSLVWWGALYDYYGWQPPLGNDFVAVDAGWYYGVALRQDGSLALWTDTTTELGTGGFVAVSMHPDNLLALRADGSLFAWNSYPVPAGSDFVAVAAGGGVSVAIRSSTPLDSDDDGLSNPDELLQGTEPLDPDTDDDGLLDGVEVNDTLTDPLSVDSDGDGLWDGIEVGLGTNPNNPDTDGDGVIDPQDPTPLTPGVPGSWIESEIRDEAAAVMAFELSLIDAPNSNAAAGRRNALSISLSTAANLVASGNRVGAIAELTTLLGRLDGDPSPPDWMVDGPEMDALVADIQLMIALLSIP